VTDDETIERLLWAFQDVAYESLRVLPINGCIGATRITIDVLSHFGLTARPCAVTLRACNHDPRHPESVSTPVVYAIGAGKDLPGDPRPGKWDGHLVAIVENQWLVDASIKQVERPEYGLRIEEPILLAPTPAWFFDERRGPLVGETGTGCWLVYQWDPANRDFIRGGDWKGNHLRPVVATIIRNMKAVIHEETAGGS
jgi:hypothetical protein